MTPAALDYILAKGDSEMRFIFIFVAAAVWIFVEIAKAVKRAGEQQTMRQRLQGTRADIQQNLRILAQQREMQASARPPVRLAPEIARRVPPATIPGRLQKQQRRAQSTPANRMRAEQAAPTRQAIAVEPLQAATAGPSIIPARPANKVPVQASASSLNDWLNPGTLRKQFILTEILQPPLALRDG
jgi:hypothetical protein